jgi:hypothetical protein
MLLDTKALPSKASELIKIQITRYKDTITRYKDTIPRYKDTISCI